MGRLQSRSWSARTPNVFLIFEMSILPSVLPSDREPVLPRRALLRRALPAALGLSFAASQWLREDRAACAAEVTPSSGNWNLPGSAPHLIVHYMAWFKTMRSATDPTPDWDHWKWSSEHAKHDPEKRLPDGRRDIDSVLYPLIGPYTPLSPTVLRYHMETIRAMGGEAVAVDWYAEGHFTDTCIPAILDAAQQAGLKVTLCYEEKINFIWPDRRKPATRADAVDAAVKDLRYALTRYATHPAFLRRDGRPFLFQFNGYGKGRLGDNEFTPEEYRAIFDRLGEPIYYGRQGLTKGYETTTDCRFLWFAHDAPAIRKFGEACREKINRGEAKFFMGFVAPGFDDTGVWGWNNKPRVTPRRGLSFLKGTLDNCLTGGPELVQAVTWNDFQEGTVLEPTREAGFWYVDALATWWAQKTGRPAPNLEAIRAPFLRYIRECSPAERAELPAPPFDDLLKPRPLTVEVPDLLERAEPSKK